MRSPESEIAKYDFGYGDGENEITVYTGSIFYADCDPYRFLIATSAEKWQAALDEELTEITLEDRRDCDNPDHDECAHEPDESGYAIVNTEYDPNCEVCGECRYCNPDLRYVGPFPESLANAYRNSETDDLIEEWAELIAADPDHIIYG